MVAGLVVGIATSIAISILLSIGFVFSPKNLKPNYEIALLIASIVFALIVTLNRLLNPISKKLIVFAGLISAVTGLILESILDRAIDAFI